MVGVCVAVGGICAISVVAATAIYVSRVTKKKPKFMEVDKRIVNIKLSSSGANDSFSFSSESSSSSLDKQWEPIKDILPLHNHVLAHTLLEHAEAIGLAMGLYQAVVCIFVADKSAASFIKECISRELEKDPDELWNDCVCNKVMESYSQLVAEQYLEKTFTPLVSQLCATPFDLDKEVC